MTRSQGTRNPGTPADLHKISGSFYGAESEEERLQEGLVENLVDSQSCINWFPSRSLFGGKTQESDRYDQNNGTQCKKQKIWVKANCEIHFLYLKPLESPQLGSELR